MSDNNPSRRKVLALSGASLGTVFATTATASESKNGVDTDFDPKKEREVYQFLKETSDVENFKRIFAKLDGRQKGAVRRAMRPQRFKTEYNERPATADETDELSTASSWETTTATYRAYAEGLYPYDELWSFGVEATWEHDGTEVRNLTSKYAVETSHPLWHFKKVLDETNRVETDSIECYKQAKFAYCEPLKVGCVKSNTPYIEIHGTDYGSHWADSNYKKE